MSCHRVRIHMTPEETARRLRLPFTDVYTIVADVKGGEEVTMKSSSLAVFFWAMLAGGCSKSDDCIPIEQIPERGTALLRRLRSTAEQETSEGRPGAKIGDWKCESTLGYPSATSQSEEDEGNMTWFKKAVTAMMELSASDVLTCSGSAAKPNPLFYECLEMLLMQRLAKDSAWKAANGLNKFQAERSSLGWVDAKCAPKTVFLRREGPDPVAGGAALLFEYILSTGGNLVPSPAAIPLLYPGRSGSGEEACIDLPDPPAKKCADESGCSDRPAGAENTGTSSSTGGDVIPPGSDPGVPGGDHL